MSSKMDKLAGDAGALNAAREADQVLARAAEDEIEAVKRRIFLKIDEGTLGPQEAFAAWVSFHAISRLQRRLGRIETKGSAAAKQLAELVKHGGDQNG